MPLLLLTVLAAFAVTFLAMPRIIKVAAYKKLYDVPNARKLHTKPIASLGGIGIFAGFFLASLMSIRFGVNPEIQYLFVALAVMFVLGIKDDLLVISAQKKFWGQMVAAAIVIHLGKVQITGMHGLFGFESMPQPLAIFLSYACVIVVVNAYNLIDGVDGLAGSLGLLTTTFFGTYFWLNGLDAYAILCFTTSASLAAFLVFNYNPARIFMGDSGSLTLGLLNAIMMMKFMDVAANPLTSFPLPAEVAIGVSVLMVPLIDTLRVFGIRISQGRSPFSADRNHLHHLLLDRGMNHKHVTLCLVLVNALFIAVAYSTRSLGASYAMLIIVAMAFGLLGVLLKVPKVQTAGRPAAESMPLPVNAPAPVRNPHAKVLTMSGEPVAAEG